MAEADSDTRTAILIAAYNAEATLERAVNSALEQPETAEICIVDDASKDATAQLGLRLAAAHPRVRFIRLEVNSGPAAARNAAIGATQSPWLTVLDADDFMLPGRLAALHGLAAGADFIGDALIRTAKPASLHWSAAPLTPRPLDFRTFVLGNLGDERGPLDLGFLKPLMRRAFLATHKLSYKPELRLGEDYELYARALALRARFIVCGEAGYVSVEREGSLSKDHGDADLQRLRDCDDGLTSISGLTPADIRALARHRTSVDCRLQWRQLINAVKVRDLKACLATFHSPHVAAYLCGKLAEQAWLRSTGRGPRRRAQAAG
jgi:succinoglycan biosynthesis protein ExoU